MVLVNDMNSRGYGSSALMSLSIFPVSMGCHLIQGVGYLGLLCWMDMEFRGGRSITSRRNGILSFIGYPILPLMGYSVRRICHLGLWSCCQKVSWNHHGDCKRGHAHFRSHLEWYLRPVENIEEHGTIKTAVCSLRKFFALILSCG